MLFALLGRGRLGKHAPRDVPQTEAIGRRRRPSGVAQISIRVRAARVGNYNLRLPSKIVTQVLEPIDITAQFGKKPDVADVDAHVRKVMQSALTDLAAQRRFPVLG
jgi:hypothetical protein